jgi:hypothetical protein
MSAGFNPYVGCMRVFRRRKDRADISVVRTESPFQTANELYQASTGQPLSAYTSNRMTQEVTARFTVQMLALGCAKDTMIPVPGSLDATGNGPNTAQDRRS